VDAALEMTGQWLYLDEPNSALAGLEHEQDLAASCRRVEPPVNRRAWGIFSSSSFIEKLGD